MTIEVLLSGNMNRQCKHAIVADSVQARSHSIVTPFLYEGVGQAMIIITKQHAQLVPSVITTKVLRICELKYVVNQLYDQECAAEW